MTEQRKKRLQVKLQEARYRLMDTQPMFALLLMYLKFVAVDDMKKISTNGRCIFFSPEYVDKLYINELDFALCHVLMHIVNHNLPFGGVQNSGIGNYHGKFSYETFSHKKAVLKTSTLIDFFVKYPPFGKERIKWIKNIF